jgi:hypothetical protein
MTQDLPSYRDALAGFGTSLGVPADGGGRAMPAPAATAQDFVDALLAALTQMAALSPRRQADVAVAMRRDGLSCTADEVAAALDWLVREGCIDRPLHLSDGGILVSVTARGIERLAMTSHRHVVAGLMARAPG